jgi:hypothetical protein
MYSYCYTLLLFNPKNCFTDSLMATICCNLIPRMVRNRNIQPPRDKTKWNGMPTVCSITAIRSIRIHICGRDQHVMVHQWSGFVSATVQSAEWNPGCTPRLWYFAIMYKYTQDSTHGTFSAIRLGSAYYLCNPVNSATHWQDLFLVYV